jgi:pyruvate/2-oxoacid:ferredoxin oxidoreductase alpha subunit
MVCLDGVYLSFVSETVDIPDQEQVDGYLPPYRPTYRIPGGGWKLYDTSSAFSEAHAMDLLRDRYELHKQESRCLEKVIECDRAFEAVFGRSYPPVEEYGCEGADVVVMLAGSAAGTARFVVDRMKKKGLNVGLVKLKMFRPYPKELLRAALAGRKKILVIDRDISVGQCGIIYQELKWALSGLTVCDQVYGFVSGLGGADITPMLIEKAIQFTLSADRPGRDVHWLGLGRWESEDHYDRSAVKIF